MSRYKVDICGINTNELKVLNNAEMVRLFQALQAGDLSAKETLIPVSYTHLTGLSAYSYSGCEADL